MRGTLTMVVVLSAAVARGADERAEDFRHLGRQAARVPREGD